MALKLNEKYPGYMNAPSIDYPQGSFKNRTSPTAEDGSYFDQDWANDDQGFKQSLLSASGVTANGQVDKVGASQYFDALKKVIANEVPKATESVAGVAKIATSSDLTSGVNDEAFVTSKKIRAGFSMRLGDAGFITFPTWLGGFIIQWGAIPSIAAGGTVQIAYPMAFASTCACTVGIGGAQVGTSTGWLNGFNYTGGVGGNRRTGASFSNGSGAAPTLPGNFLTVGY